MATAPDSPGAGGKMGGFEYSSECDLCESTKTVKFCPECQFTLCHACSKGHGKIQATKDHPLLEISMIASNASFTKSGDAESGPSQCAKHPDDVLDFYCEKCTVLICGKCRLDHKGHPVQSVKDDLKMYQNICTQHIKKLLDKTHDLEEHKLLVEGIFDCYDTAIQTVEMWKRELTELIEECSRSLREDLEKAKQEWENIVNDDEKGLNKMTEGVENQLSKLYNIRKISNMDIFSHELVASQQLLAKFNHFVENIMPTLTVLQVEDILPNISALPKVKTGVASLMTSDKTIESIFKDHSSVKESGKRPLPDFCDLTRKSDVSVPYPNSFKGYKINSSYIDNTHIMIHGVSRKDVRILDLNDNSLAKLTSQCEIDSMISTATDEYVAVRKTDLYLLNSKFEVIETRTTSKTCKGVSPTSDHTFLLLEMEEKNGQEIAHIAIINIQNGHFSFAKTTSFKVEEKMDAITTGEDKTYAFIRGGNHLYKVYLKTSEYQHVDMSQWASRIWSMYAGRDLLLVGDSKGKIHSLDKELRNMQVVLDISTIVRDIAFINGYFIVTSGDNKIYVYK